MSQNTRFPKGHRPWNKGLIKASEEKVDPQLGKEIGGTGTLLYNGYLSSTDYNSEWVGTRRIAFVDRMRKGDATVRAAMLAVTLPILSANWFIEPASDDPKDKEIADKVKENLFGGMDRPWQEMMREILLFLAYGCYPFEEVWGRDASGFIKLEKLAPRHPNTVIRWEMDNKEPGIVQMLPSGGSPQIPMDKLCIFVNEKEGDNWEGNSILRPAYSAWSYKDTLYRVVTIAAERQGTGLPYIVLPTGSTDADEDKAQELLRNLRANEEAFFIGRRTEKGEEIKPEFTDMKAGSTKDPMELILHFDRQIVKAVLAQFLELGASGGSGSRALSEDQSSMFLLNLKATARYVAETIDKNVIRRLVDFNWIVDKYPKLNFSEIGETDYTMLAQALSQFVTAGVVSPDKPMEKYIRDVMDLPELVENPEPASNVQTVVNMKERVDGVLNAIEDKFLNS